MKYELRDDGGSSKTVEAESMEEALELAEDWVRSGDWGDKGADVDVYIIAYDDAGEEIEHDTITITVEAEEPDCLDDVTAHDWRSPYAIVGGIKENPGVWGHGGGVIIDEVCMICGTGKTTDTWAQNHHGRQGLRRVSYQPRKYTPDDVSGSLDYAFPVDWDVSEALDYHRDEYGLVIGRTTILGHEYSASYEVDADGNCDISEDDHDILPGDLEWPQPPQEYVDDAKGLIDEHAYDGEG